MIDINGNIKNEEVYKMYNGKMYMKHTIEIFTPIADNELGSTMFIEQNKNSDAHKEVLNLINQRISDVISDNLNCDVGKVTTTVHYGERFDIDEFTDIKK